MNPDKTAPKWSSLIWVHIVCKIGYLRTSRPEEQTTIVVTGLKRVMLGQGLTQRGFTHFFMEANTMHPDQTASKWSSLIWVHIVAI